MIEHDKEHNVYRLTDSKGKVLGLFGSLESATWWERNIDDLTIKGGKKK